MEHSEAGQAVLPSYGELERAIASVPGVVDASVGRSETTGRSRLRIRLASGEDAKSVSWAVAATLRERFGIALDPDDIRPRPAADVDDEVPDADGALDTVRVIEDPTVPEELPLEELPLHGSGRASDASIRQLPGGDVTAAERTSSSDLSQARARLSSAASEALARFHEDAGERSRGRSDRATDSSADDGIDDSDGPDGGVVDGGATGHAGPVAPGRSVRVAQRASISHLDTRVDHESVRVTATLEHAGRSSDGRAMTIATSHGVLRAVAEATLESLRGLADGRLLAGIDRVAVQATDPAIATVVVTIVTERGEESLLGASVVRGDPERAVMRATLDALNRRVAALLDAAVGETTARYGVGAQPA